MRFGCSVGTLADRSPPNHPRMRGVRYSPNTRCQWLVWPESRGTTSITLTFLSVDLEEPCAPPPTCTSGSATYGSRVCKRRALIHLNSVRGASDTDYVPHRGQ